MSRFKSILFIDDPGRECPDALERAVAVAETQQAGLTLLRVLEPPPAGLLREFPDLAGTLEQKSRAALEGRCEPYRGRVALQVRVTWGVPFVEAIREVLRHGHDLIIKAAGEAGGLADRLFGSTDMHLLRKAPCPVWLLKPLASPSYQCILAAVDFDPFQPRPGEEELNLQILELAVALAVSETTDLHVVHVWDSLSEDMLRVWGMDGAEGAIVAYSEGERQRHTEYLDRLLAETGRRVGADAYGYAKPIKQVVRGMARSLVPALAKRLGADLIVMGTVGRTGIPGLIIGNTAEAILERVECAVLAAKPQGFVTPVTLPEGGAAQPEVLPPA
jgi:universal stress protein E